MLNRIKNLVFFVYKKVEFSWTCVQNKRLPWQPWTCILILFARGGPKEQKISENQKNVSAIGQSVLKKLMSWGIIVLPIGLIGLNKKKSFHRWAVQRFSLERILKTHYSDKLWMNKEKITRTGFELATSGCAGALPTELTSHTLAVSLLWQCLCSGAPVGSHSTRPYTAL